MTNNLGLNAQSHLPERSPEMVEKDVRKWVESICEFKANIDMEKCELPPKKTAKKVRKTKVKKKISNQSIIEGDNIPKAMIKVRKSKTSQKKEGVKEKVSKEVTAPVVFSAFENMRENFKNLKLPPHWVSGQSRGRLVFCRVKVLARGSQSEMVSDRGITITSDCLVHVFIEGPEIILSNWKMQKAETVEDIRKIIKTVDGFKVCSGMPPNGVKSPSCSIFLNGETKTCQACKSDSTNMKTSKTKMRTNTKVHQKLT